MCGWRHVLLASKEGLTYDIRSQNYQGRLQQSCKGKEMAARKPQVPSTLESERRAYVHTLSLRLTDEQYRKLRRFVIGHEERTGQRITHQAVLEAALANYLDR